MYLVGRQGTSAYTHPQSFERGLNFQTLNFPGRPIRECTSTRPAHSSCADVRPLGSVLDKKLIDKE